MKIAIKLRQPDAVWNKYFPLLKEKVDTEVLYDSELKNIYPDIEMMITTHINESVLDKFPSLRYIFLFKTGMDGLPEQHLKKNYCD